MPNSKRRLRRECCAPVASNVRRFAVRIFYFFWFFFCAGWGYLSATFPTQPSPSLVHAVVTFPATLAMSTGILWYELRGLPIGALASPPSLHLKPWNRPIGLALFIGLTFAFSGVWGIAMALTFVLPSPLVALHFMAMGAGLAGGCFVAHYLFPQKFSA